MTYHRIDALQYCNWSETVFRQMRDGRVDAVHATVAYHEDFAEVVHRLKEWADRFREHADLIIPGRTGVDVRKARATGRTAIFFGFQNPAPIGADLGMLEICHQLGIRFMQLTYNLQSLCGAGWQEPEDTGLTKFGREVVAEMNRLGMIVDLSHAGARTTLETIEASGRPVAVTHANPRSFRATNRNVPDEVISALAETGGMLGFSLYPHHLSEGGATTLNAFCRMVAETAEITGPERLGIGSDLCQGQPDNVVQWMRDGRWTREKSGAAFPPQPAWFQDNRDWDGIADGLRAVGFSADEVGGILGENWLAFWEAAMVPE